MDQNLQKISANWHFWPRIDPTHFFPNCSYLTKCSLEVGGQEYSITISTKLAPQKLWFVPRSIHDVKATDMGAHTVRFKAEVNFDGREVARVHVNKLDLEKLLKV